MAIDPVVIDFAVSGMPSVMRSFDSVEKRLERMERAASRSTQAGAKVRIRTTQEETKERDRAYQKLVKDIEREEAKRLRSEERAAKVRVRTEQQAAKAQERIRQQAAVTAGRYAEQQARTEVKAAEKAAREVERLEQYKLRLRMRSAEMAGRFAEQEAAREAAVARRRSRTAVGVLGAGFGASSTLGRLGRGAMGLAGATVGIGGGFLVADAVKKEFSAERTAALIVNAATTGAKPPPEATVKNLVGQASQVSRELGIDKGEILQATLEYSRKARGGDIKGAIGNMGFLAKMAQVTGADITEIAGAAGILQSQNPALTKDPKQMQQMLLDVYAQGKAGSMSMTDVAKQIGMLASTRSSYAGDQATNQRKLLALGQLAAPEGTVEEAGTFIKNLATEAATHRKSTKDTVGLEQMGVHYDKYGRMESPEQMIQAVFRSTKGDLTKMEKIFGIRGMPLFRSLLPEYTAAGGGEKGIAAITAKMASVTGATMTPEQLEEQNRQIMETPGKRLEVAVNKIVDTLEKAIGPSLEKFAERASEWGPKVEELIQGAAKLADWFIANPFTGLGLVVAGAVTKDIAQAAIGAAVKSILTQLIASAMGGGSAIGGAGRAVGGAAGALGVVGAAAGVALVGNELLQQNAAEKADANRQAIGASNAGSNVASDLMAKVRAGTVTPADIAKATNVKGQMEQQLGAKKAEAASAGGWSPWTGMLGSSQRVANAEGEVKNFELALKNVVNALRSAEAAIKTHADTASKMQPPSILKPDHAVPISNRPAL